MKTIIVNREVLDTIKALHPFPDLLIDDARTIARGWELDVTDDVYRRLLANRKKGESISDVVLRHMREGGRAGMRRVYQRIERQRARQRASRRATGL